MVILRRKGRKNGGLLYCGNKSEGDRKEMMMIWFGEGVDGQGIKYTKSMKKRKHMNNRVLRNPK